MSFTVKLVLILFGLAYLISPMDLIPDQVLPWVGWIDDSLILWSIYHLIRYGELPGVGFKKKKRGPGRSKGPGTGRHSKTDRTARNTQAGQHPGEEQSGSFLKKERTGQAEKSPHEILGVSKTASWPEIQFTYKEKIKQYHPDKLSHLGKEFADLANEKFLEIQAAYEAIKKENSP